MALLQLGEMCERPEWLALVDRALAAFSTRLVEQPHAAPLLVSALGWRLDGPTHVVVAGEAGDARTVALAAAARRAFVPRRVLVLADAATREALRERAPWLAAMTPVGGVPAAYVCKDRACDRPQTSPDDLVVRLVSPGR
jgi:hypothetical protein